MENDRYIGAIICRERLKKNWNQGGLAKGICSVSYLSKIETGAVSPSGEIIELLFNRLGLESGKELEKEAAKLSEKLYELIISHMLAEATEILQNIDIERFKATKQGLDFLLMSRLVGISDEAIDESLKSCMDNRELALYSILEEKFDDAIIYFPSAITYYYAGQKKYLVGDYVSALELLKTAYDLAANDGYLKVMMLSKIFIGNCYSNMGNYERMNAHYAVAKRIILLLGEIQHLNSIEYNIAATEIELGEYEKAYEFFSKLENPNKLSLHKLAICCEKLNLKEEALNALNKADAQISNDIPEDLARKMCDIVRFRIENENYLQSEKYGNLLIDCFNDIEKQLSTGFAIFHLPWLTEWYKASRQYKKAFESIEKYK